MSFPLGMTSFPLYGDCLPPVRTTGELDALGLGGHGSMPAHLTRVLYIPAHGSDATHVQIHDFTAQYAAATRGLAVGGSRFRTRLFTMAKPAGNDVAGRVSYLVDIDPQGLHAVVRERSLGREEQQLCMSLVSEQEGTFHLHTQGAGSGSSYIAESSLCQEERRSLSLEERLFFSPEERRHPRLTLKQEPTSLGTRHGVAGAPDGVRMRSLRPGQTGHGD
ncbi:hypothetical protein OCS_06717 [Ophiocordyceps sinensis CO18]|uniref:Uncharacterized protein n=1 Tax=Ophiocordyceps sinensis (strain Co18 / CGMCC 3.14243) TaxID=911162 RepID=T5A589_OPHSC|nr:hypothetical protein OCS_06717 [Ophiocordyceps sinensis CO18]